MGGPINVLLTLTLCSNDAQFLFCIPVSTSRYCSLDIEIIISGTSQVDF